MTKNKLSIAPPDKKKTLEAFFRYYELSRLLFGQSKTKYMISRIFRRQISFMS